MPRCHAHYASPANRSCSSTPLAFSFYWRLVACLTYSYSNVCAFPASNTQLYVDLRVLSLGHSQFVPFVMKKYFYLRGHFYLRGQGTETFWLSLDVAFGFVGVVCRGLTSYLLSLGIESSQDKSRDVALVQCRCADDTLTINWRDAITCDRSASSGSHDVTTGWGADHTLFDKVMYYFLRLVSFIINKFHFPTTVDIKLTSVRHFVPFPCARIVLSFRGNVHRWDRRKGARQKASLGDAGDQL